jgi:hypothetical protein
MANLRARTLIRTLNEQRIEVKPLNVEKWRGALRDIRNTLIKLRDKAELELDRIEDVDFDDLTPAESSKLDKLHDHLESCVDYLGDSINQIDACL